MFEVIPRGEVYQKNSRYLTQLEKGSSMHWVIFDDCDNRRYRALYNGLTYWVKVFVENEDGSMIRLFDLQTEIEEDPDTGEEYLPNVTEEAIREFLAW